MNKSLQFGPKSLIIVGTAPTVLIAFLLKMQQFDIISYDPRPGQNAFKQLALLIA